MFQGQEQKRPLDPGRPKALPTDSERGDLPSSPPPRRPPASGLSKHWLEARGSDGLSLSLSPRRAQGEVTSSKYAELLASPNVYHFLRCVASGGEACLDDEGVVEGEGQSSLQPKDCTFSCSITRTFRVSVGASGWGGEVEEVKEERLRFPQGERVGLTGEKQTPSRFKPIISLLHQRHRPKPQICYAKDSRV